MKPIKTASQQEMTRLTLLILLQPTAFCPNDMVNPLFQKIRNLEFHLRRSPSLQLNVIVKTKNPKEKRKYESDQVNDPRE